MTVWKKCPGFPHYSVSDDGNVRRDVAAQGAQSGAILRKNRSSKYHAVCLRRDGSSVTQYVHRLVCLAFHGEPSSPDLQVAHADGNPINNVAFNLRWATPTENCADKKLHGTNPAGMRHPMRKLTDNDVRSIREQRRSGVSLRELSTVYGICIPAVCSIAKGNRWKHVA